MKQAKDILQQKIRNRRLSIEWTARQVSAPAQTPPDPIVEELNRLDQALQGAAASQTVTPYAPISSNKRLIGPVIVLFKRALRRFFHVFLGWYIYPICSRQSEFNSRVLNAVALERDLLCVLRDQCSEFTHRLDEQSSRLSDLAEENARHAALLGTVQALCDESARMLDEQSSQLSDLAEENARHAALLGTVQALCDESARMLDEQSSQLSDLAEENARTADLLGTLQIQNDDFSLKIHEQAADLTHLGESYVRISNTIDVLQNQCNDFSHKIHGQTAQLEHFVSESARTTDTLGMLQTQCSESARMLSDHSARLDKLTYVSHLDNSFYHDFEERHRGSFEEICDKESAYIPLVKEQVGDFANAHFVDIGSGRGEWLELLRANGATNCIGIDLNEIQNELARGRGHKAVQMDGILYLQSLPDESVDAVTAFQLVEHLTLDQLMALIRECLRVLKKGGMILFETNNPSNLIVGADTFYLDPTHYRPLDSRLLSFLVEYIGFAQVRVVDSHSHPFSSLLPAQDEEKLGEELCKRVNALSWSVFGPQDYAVLAVKE